MRLEPALAGALVAAQDQVSLPTSVRGIAELFGEGSRGVTSLASALFELGLSTGTSENARKNVRRSVERWIRTENGDTGPNARRPSARYREALDKLAASRVDRATVLAMKRDGVTIHFSGEVIVSPGGKRPDARDRDIDVELSGDAARAFLDKLIARDLESAGDEFSAAMLEGYGIGAPAVISDVDNLELFIGTDETPF